MKILVYDDNPDFGGHQVMACHGIGALSAQPSVEVSCMVNPTNTKLAEKLRGAGIPACPPQAKLSASQTNLALCIQGDIAQSTDGIKAAKKAGIECVSYLALPHSLAAMGAKLGAVRDRKNRRFINAPDRFITISGSMKQHLIDRGCTKPIIVVPNGVEIPSSFTRKPKGPITIGVIGRVECKQKQQDFMVRTFLGQPGFEDCELLMVGSGPDEATLKTMASGRTNIRFLPWQEDMESVYEQIDCLAIPSRYEGVPLVMLEALVRGIPVIGSARDGMKDILPKEWTFEPGNATELAAAFTNARKTRPEKTAALQQQMAENHSLDTFKANFVKAVLS